jgi:hypothetical protein
MNSFAVPDAEIAAQHGAFGTVLQYAFRRRSGRWPIGHDETSTVLSAEKTGEPERKAYSEIESATKTGKDRRKGVPIRGIANKPGFSDNK